MTIATTGSIEQIPTFSLPRESLTASATGLVDAHMLSASLVDKLPWLTGLFGNALHTDGRSAGWRWNFAWLGETKGTAATLSTSVHAGLQSATFDALLSNGSTQILDSWSLGDLAHLVVEPLLRDRVAIAHKAARAGDGATKVDEDTIAGIAIWATVSEAVDAKIADQVRAGTYPVRLAPDDWVSGDTVWLLDVIAADRRQATAVLANFRQLAGERPVRIHPMVARLIEPEVLEKQKRSAASEPSPPAK